MTIQSLPSEQDTSLHPCFLPVSWKLVEIRTVCGLGYTHERSSVDIHYTTSLQLFAHVLSAILKCVTWTNTYFEVRKIVKVLFEQIEQRKTEAQKKKKEQRNKETWNERTNINWRFDIFAAKKIHSAETVGLPARLYDVLILKTTIWKAVMSEIFETLFVWNVPRCPSCYEEVNLLFIIMANIMLA